MIIASSRKCEAKTLTVQGNKRIQTKNMLFSSIVVILKQTR